MPCVRVLKCTPDHRLSKVQDARIRSSPDVAI